MGIRPTNTSKSKIVTKSTQVDSRELIPELLSTHFLFCNEKIENAGEDSGIEIYTENAGMLGAFDGCGGLGGRKCSGMSEKTEAYIASRAVCCAAKKWFEFNAHENGSWNKDHLKAQIMSALEICMLCNEGNGIKLKGSMARPFPSTLAMIVFHKEKGQLVTEHFWAGDSRTYVLDAYGLGQISVDDIEGDDAMSNLVNDGSLNNVISADGKFVIHSHRFIPKNPSVLFSASDGCFGYVSSPMEFEYLILACLMKAGNVHEWKEMLSREISEKSGDDQTFAAAAFGFDSFSDLKKYFAKRFDVITELMQLNDKYEGRVLNQIWEKYKPYYYRNIANRNNKNERNNKN